MSVTSGKRPTFTSTTLPRLTDFPSNPKDGEFVSVTAESGVPEGMYQYLGGNWTLLSEDKGGYITNPNALIDLSGWGIYNNGSSATPTTGTGGTPSGALDLVRDDTSKIVGKSSFKIEHSATNTQGEGVSTDFAIDNALKYSPLTISFKYEKGLNFNYGEDSDIKVFIYDIDNSSLITPAINYLDGSGTFTSNFSSTDSLNYRLILHCATTNALGWAFYFGDVIVGELKESFIPFMSDMQPVTVTGSWTSNTTYSAMMAVQGEFAFLSVKVSLTGAPNAASLNINLPNGLKINESLVYRHDDVGIFISDGEIRDAGVRGYVAKAKYLNNPNQFQVAFESTAALTNIPAYSGINNTAPITFGSGDSVIINVKVPIVGWTSGVKTQGQMLQNLPVVFRAYKNGGSIPASTSGPITAWTIDYDSTGSMNASSGQFTAPTTGYYSVVGSVGTTSNSGDVPMIFVNGVEKKRSGNNASAVQKEVSDLVFVEKGQTIDIRFSSANTASSSNTQTIFSVVKQLDSNTLLAINRSTTKYLASNITSSTTDIASLRMTNLIVGKRYRVDMNFNGQTTGGLVVKSMHDGVHRGEWMARGSSNDGGMYNSVAFFTATTTTLTFDAAVTTSGTLYGSGTASQSQVTLTELNNTVEGNF